MDQVQMNFTETEPRFVAAYRVALASEDAFESVLDALAKLQIGGNDRERESLRRISLYLGTLFGEAHAASTQLGFSEMPRAQYILNRVLIEYYARNRWFVENRAATVLELDLLPKTVYDEVQNNPKAFNIAGVREEIAKNYAEWAALNPELDAIKHKLPGMTKMVELALDDGEDLFWYYGDPSILMHGKTQGIQDVLRRLPDGGVERHIGSPRFDRVAELCRATGYALRYGFLLAINFDLDHTKVMETNAAFDASMRAMGIIPETVTVRRYS